MKIQYPLALAILFASVYQPCAIAAPHHLTQTQLEQQMQKLMARTQLLEHEVHALRKQLRDLKHKQTTETAQTPAIRPIKTVPQHNGQPKQEPDIRPIKTVPQSRRHAHGKSSNDIRDLYGTGGVTYLGGTPVVSSPYLGVRSEFDASDLIVNISSINEDLRFLKQRQQFEKILLGEHNVLPQHPWVNVSGKVETSANAIRPYVGRSTGDVNLSAAQLDTLINVNRWATGFISLTYDDSPLNTGVQRVNNSRVFLNKAFGTLGNLNRFPFYFTAGQFFVPFGHYSSNMLSSPLTLPVGRTKARAVLLGYKQPGDDNSLFASTYGFKGDSSQGAKAIVGANAGYDFTWHGFSGEVASGYISNIADAGGMQATGGTGFTGFGLNSLTERIQHDVPGWDTYANISYGPWSVLSEYVTATRSFSPLDMTYNGLGAKPAALNLEAAYRFMVDGKPVSIAVGYGRTKQALALNLPKQRFTAAISTSIWRDTIESLEFRHDINYPFGTTAAGLGGATGVLTPVITGGALGKTSDAITAQIGFYF